MEWSELRKAITAYLSRYSDLGVFYRAVRLKWYDALFGASATGIPMTALIALFHLSWFWLLVIFVGGFAAAAYGSWRDEYTKSTRPSLRAEISTIKFVHLIRNVQEVYLTLVIRNTGTATALDRWSVEFELKDSPRHVFAQWELEQGQDGPDGKPGGNLIRDNTTLEQGGRRCGWLSFRIPSEEADRLMMEKSKLAVRFRDMSDRRYTAS